ncbi:MAG: M28 family peptidase [Planctomycetota bacterium]
MPRSRFNSGSSACVLLACVAGWAAGAGPAASAAEKDAPKLPRDVRHVLESITGKDIVAHAKVLCDPKFRGREASAPESRQAAGYIAGQFRKLGLRPGGGAGSYLQSFKIRLGYRVAAEMEAKIGKLVLDAPKLGRDYMPVHLPGGKAEFSGQCALVGYGITSTELKFDEYADLDAKGKVVIAFSGVPWGPQTAAWIRRAGDTRALDSIEYKARNAAEHGAAALMLVDDPAGWRTKLAVAERLRVPDKGLAENITIPVLHVTRDFLATVTRMSPDELRLLAVDVAQERAPSSMALRGREIRFKASIAGRAEIGRNVVGILPGRDEKLRREAVVVGAHYDHLGEMGDEVFFGANDNAAGVGAVLDIAGAFTRLPSAPRRSIVFVAFDAEEIGKLGSKSYISKPAIPMQQTVFMINFDMIGRNEPGHINAVATLSSPDVHEIHQRVNRHVGLKLSHPAGLRLGLSDHTYFYYAQVPVMYLFGGRDRDYNTPRDTWDKLIPGKTEKVARLAFLTALEVADGEARPRFQHVREAERRRLPPLEDR